MESWQITDFFADEAGAVTADWTMVAGGVTGFCLVVAAAVTPAVEGVVFDIGVKTARAGTQIVSALQGIIDNGGTPSEYGPGDNPGDLRTMTSGSFAADVLLDPNDTGILLEAGGTGNGIVMYQYNGTLYLRAGNGSSTDPNNTSWAEVSYDVQGGETLIEASMDASGGIILYIDGVEQDSAYMSTGALSGSDGAGLGTMNGNSVAVNRGGFGAGDDYTGHIAEVRVYDGQTIN